MNPAESSEATDSPNKLDPSFLPNKNSGKWYRRPRAYFACAGCGIIALLALAVFLIVIFESVIPNMTQTVIDNAYLDVQKVVLSSPTSESFNLSMDVILKRDRKIPAYMHDTELAVYVASSKPTEEEDSSTKSDGARPIFRRMQTSPSEVAPPPGEVFLGTLEIPALKMSGFDTPMTLRQVFAISSQEAFDEFTVALMRNGEAAWHIKGTTVVTVLGKVVTDLNFDKTVVMQGPSFMAPPESVGEDKASEEGDDVDNPRGDVVLPKVTGISAEPRPDGALDVMVNMTVTNPGKASMDPLGAVLFELSWSGLPLGELETDVISVLPGENEIELWGVWDVNAHLKGLSFFEMVRVAKLLNELRLMGQNGESVSVNALGVACSIPLYDAAVRSIDATFTIEHFNLDLTGGDEEEEEEEEEEADIADEVEDEEDEEDEVPTEPTAVPSDGGEEEETMFDAEEEVGELDEVDEVIAPDETDVADEIDDTGEVGEVGEVEDDPLILPVEMGEDEVPVDWEGPEDLPSQPDESDNPPEVTTDVGGDEVDNDISTVGELEESTGSEFEEGGSLEGELDTMAR